MFREYVNLIDLTKEPDDHSAEESEVDNLPPVPFKLTATHAANRLGLSAKLYI